MGAVSGGTELHPNCIPVHIGIKTEHGEPGVMIYIDQNDMVVTEQMLTPEDSLTIVALLRDVADAIEKHKRRLDH